MAVGCCLTLAFGATNGEYPGDGGMLIWPIFGASNQILASLTLLVLSVYLMRLKRTVGLLPWRRMIFIVFVAFWASLWYLFDYYQSNNWLLLALSLAVMAASIVVMLDGSFRDREDSPRAKTFPPTTPSRRLNELACVPAETFSAGVFHEMSGIDLHSLVKENCHTACGRPWARFSNSTGSTPPMTKPLRRLRGGKSGHCLIVAREQVRGDAGGAAISGRSPGGAGLYFSLVREFLRCRWTGFWLWGPRYRAGPCAPDSATWRFSASA